MNCMIRSPDSLNSHDREIGSVCIFFLKMEHDCPGIQHTVKASITLKAMPLPPVPSCCAHWKLASV